MSAKTHTVKTTDKDAGTRLDQCLAGAVADLSRSRLKALILDGRVVLRDGAEARAAQTISDPSYRVKPGQTFAIIVPETLPPEPVGQAMDLDVVFEDEHLIVVNKPAGLVVHPAAGNPDRTLVNALIAHCGDSLSGIGGVGRPGIVHRLDKDTSGLMVVAKTDRAHAGLAAQFSRHDLDRAYHAVVWGVPRPRAGAIDGNIGRSPANRKKMAVVRRGGKVARTNYRVLQAFSDVSSLVECRLATGRTHQIRVHMASKGHPVIGDPLYGRGRAAAKGSLTSDGLAYIAAFKRQALHAFLIGFDHPDDGRRVEFRREIPYDIKTLIDYLEVI
ncbi:MAG: RluA family pseudouridine synthase [Methyloligellaceae bacterium]